MKKYLILLFVAAAAVFQSCDNNDDLWDAIDDLKSRVQALETQVNALNDNVKALQTLYSGATVSEVKNEEGKCTITLTDGKKLTLVSDIDALVPVVSINEETGMWQYSIGGGEPQSLNVKAVAEDGKTPTFQVTDDGYWQVDLGDGQGWRDVTYADGGKVSAITDTPTEDKFFQTVEVVGDSLHIVMQNGDELDIPIVKGFLCQIVTEKDGVQIFPADVTKKYTVNMRGVETWILTAPEGWMAELSEPTDGADGLKVFELSVTSPAPTRATASTAKDVSILANSGKYSCIAKIQVESTGQAPVPPTVSVTLSERTTESLTFALTLSEDTESWKYLCLKSTEEKPTVETVTTSGQSGTGTNVMVSGLDGNTAYTIYVVAYANGLNSEVAEAEGKTMDPDADPNDYYANGVEIEGVTYNQESDKLKMVSSADGEATLELSSTLSVYFLDGNRTDNAVVINTANNYMQGDAVFIGRYADKKTKLKLQNHFHLRNKDAIFAFKNLDIDMTNGANSQIFTMTADAGGAKTLLFEDCDITLGNDKCLFATYSSTKAASYVENIIFRNCKILFQPGTQSSYGAIKLTDHVKDGLANFKTLIFENNVLYSKQGASVSTAVSLLYQQYQDPDTYSLSNLVISCKNNTFVDFISFGSGGSNPVGIGSAYFMVSKIGSVEFSKNVLYATADKYVSIMRVTYDYETNGSWDHINLDKTGNIAYGTKGWKLYFDGTNAPTSYYPEKATYSKKSESPLSVNNPADGTFEVSSEYAGYGSTLQ